MSPEHKNLTILLTDIKEFTVKTSHKTRADILAMLEKHKELVLPVLEAKGGRLIKTIGDAFMMVFESPTDAVLSGIAVQEVLREFNDGKVGDDRIDVRIAINVGEVMLTDDDIFGDPVNITARIESIAEAGEVFFTEAVYLAMNKREVPSSEVGLLQLKGIAEKIRVYRVKKEDPVEELPDGGDADGAPSAARPAAATPAQVPRQASLLLFKAPPAKKRVIALVIDLLICGIAGDILTGKRSHAAAVSPPAQEESAAASETVTIGKDGVDIRSGGDVVTFDKNGLRIKADGVNIEISGKNPANWKKALAEASFSAEVKKVKHLEKKKGGHPFHGPFGVIWFLYGSIFLGVYGCTPGMKILKLRIVQAASGLPITPKQAALRSFFSLISGTVFFVGYLWGLKEADRRTWHDLIAGTKIVWDPPVELPVTPA